MTAVDTFSFRLTAVSAPKFVLLTKTRTLRILHYMYSEVGISFRVLSIFAIVAVEFVYVPADFTDTLI